MALLSGRRVLIDGRTAGSVGGGFTYLANIVGHLLRQEPGITLRVLVGNDRLRRAIPPSERLETLQVSASDPLRRLWFTYVSGAREARQWGADLYYSPAEFAPVRAPCAVIAAFRNPNVFTPLDQGWSLRQRIRLATLRKLAELSGRRCDAILFVSEDSARWIGDVVSLPEERRAVVHHGIDASAWSQVSEPPPLDRPYVLSVSTIYRYKNFVRLIEAWTRLARLRPELPDLAIVGNDADPPYAARMREARAAAGPLADRIHLVGEVPYAEVRAWYAGASLFVFPSYLETFGHPLLEAMASGVPVVAADIPVFRELGADAALYADPLSEDALADAMRAVLDDPSLAAGLVERGHERVGHFTWGRAAERLASLFADVLQKREAAAVRA